MKAPLVATIMVLGLLAGSGSARATTPSPVLSTVPPVYAQPGGGVLYQVTIISTTGIPCPGAAVDLVWPPASMAMICPCPLAPFPVYTAVTNPAGVATFNVRAGGCIDPVAAGTGVNVFINGAFFLTVGQKSPDIVDSAGLMPPDCVVGLSDAVWFSYYLSTGIYHYCVDFNHSGASDLADAVILTASVASGISC